MKKALSLNDYAALIGLDWADTKHDVCLYDCQSRNVEYSQFLHRPDTINEWALALRARFHNHPILIALELKNGPLVNALSQFDFIVLVPISPQSLAKYREAFVPSGAKDDPTDAGMILDYLRRHHEKLSRLCADRADTRTLQRLVEHRRLLISDRVRVTNSLRATLKLFYPQVLDWFESIDTLLFCDFITRWPTFHDTRKTRPDTFKRFFQQHNCRSTAKIEQRIHAIQSAVSLTDDKGVIEPNTLFVSHQVRLLRELIDGIKHYDRQIAQQFRAHSDAALFASFPGAGPVYAPRLLAAMGSNRDRFQSADEVCKVVGVAPVLKRSGKKTWVYWRYACSRFLRQTFVEWAHQSLKQSYWAKAYYDAQRSKGKSHQTTLRSLAFKWIRIVFYCWKNKVLYNEATYLLSLKRKGSPLVCN